jgi:GNAT superfamily N-acetyltransferase
MISRDRLALYQSLTRAELLEDRALVAIHPALPATGTLATDGDPESIALGEAWLRAHGCTRVLGPMEVCSWFPYRALLESASDARFFGEPDANAAPWFGSGYREVARYRSTEVPCQLAIAEGATRPQTGLTVAPMRTVQEGLEVFHALSHAAFASARGFAPVSRRVFDALYAPLAERMDHRWIFIVRREATAIAFALAMPDLIAQVPGRFILKSMAVDPREQGSGLGRWLTGQIHTWARSRGYTHGVHALMADESRSPKVCASARVIRQYSLFEKELTR